jgi:hypothetical protein
LTPETSDLPFLFLSRFCACTYDASNLIEGECFGRNTASKSIPRQCFYATSEVNDAGSVVASKYVCQSVSALVATLPANASPDTAEVRDALETDLADDPGSVVASKYGLQIGICGDSAFLSDVWNTSILPLRTLRKTSLDGMSRMLGR